MIGRSALRELLAGGVRFHGYSAGWLVRQLALAGGISLFSSAALVVLFSSMWLQLLYWQLWLLLTTLLLLKWTLRPLREATPRLAEAPADFSNRELGNQPYPQLARWERRLSVTEGDTEWYTMVVRDRLAALVATRLRQRHGFQMAADPARAQAVLGPELCEALTGPVNATPTPAELTRLIARIEQI